LQVLESLSCPARLSYLTLAAPAPVSHTENSMRVLLLASGYGPQYRVLRCAAESGAEVYVVGNRHLEDAGMLASSRFCRQFIRIDDRAFDQGSGFTHQLNELCKELRIDWVLPSDARTTRYLARHHHEIASKVFPLPGLDVFERLNSKVTFSKLCQELTLPHPETRVYHDRTDLALAIETGELTLPLIAKPADRSGGSGVIKLESGNVSQELNRIDYEPVLVQTFIPGQDVCISLFCREGSIRAAVMYYYDKNTYFFFDCEPLYHLAKQVVEATNFSGVVNFDARLGPSGKVTLIECNPRFWYNMDIAMLAGLNYVTLGLSDAARGERRLGTKVVPLLKAFIRRALKPWQLSRDDFSYPAYLLKDVGFYSWVATLFSDFTLKLPSNQTSKICQ
jgi:predicted ATP-grasp superfamily ATP-dependent carboligase